jgi:AmpD protein
VAARRAAAIGADGRYSAAEFLASPNCDQRPPGCAIELLVVHGISLPPGEFGGPAVIDLFLGRLDCDAHPYFAGLRELRVSAHFLIRRDGRCLQFVSCRHRAWHAGVSSWRGRERCNDFSVGVELEGTDDRPFEPRQYETLHTLARALRRRYRIGAAAGHCDIAPGRKTDPGPCFDWSGLRALGYAR